MTIFGTQVLGLEITILVHENVKKKLIKNHRSAKKIIMMQLQLYLIVRGDMLTGHEKGH